MHLLGGISAGLFSLFAYAFFEEVKGRGSAGFKPTTLIYVSCNPAQLAKELPIFTDYAIQSIIVFDLFPQTPHIEAIAHLTLNKD